MEMAENARNKWILHRGMSNMLDFNENQIKELKKYFDSLDIDGNGSITVNELKVPMIGLGLVTTVKEVQDLIDLVDKNHNGAIEFKEFLYIIRNNQNYDK